MKLIVIISRVISMIRITHRVKRIHFPTEILTISYRRFKHLFMRIKAVIYWFKFHFKFIQTHGNKQFCKEHGPINCWIYQIRSNQQSKNSQNKNMTPNVLQYFGRTIKNGLNFMDCRNLHISDYLPLFHIKTNFRIVKNLFIYARLEKICTQQWQ